MKGAREYAQLFKIGQDGRFYIVSGTHARGLTFHLQILPEGEEAIPNGPNNLCLNKDAVEVYGIIGGQPGWTESYGWLYRGSWEEDFERMVAEAKEERRIERENKIEEGIQKARKDQKRIRLLLDTYPDVK